MRPLMIALLGAGLWSSTSAVAAMPSAQNVSLRTLTLAAGNVPYGLLPQQPRSVDDRAVAAMTAQRSSAYRKHGRIAGRETSFLRPIQHGKIPSGPFSVDDEVDVYRSADGSHWGYSAHLSVARRGKYQPNSGLSRIGDESSGFTVPTTGRPVQQDVVIWFRQGTYVVTVGFVMIGKDTSGAWKEVVHLAQIISRNIRTGGAK